MIPPYHNSKQLISDRADMGRQEKGKTFKFCWVNEGPTYVPVWQLEWKKVESLLITSSLSRIYFLEEKQWVSDCWGGREHFSTLET